MSILPISSCLTQEQDNDTSDAWVMTWLFRFLIGAFFTALFLFLRNALGPVGRGGFDEINFHRPVIESFYLQWPTPDFTDYLSATTPGFHFLLALMASAFGLLAVPVANASFSGILAGLLVVLIAKAIINKQDYGVFRVNSKGVSLALLFALPFLASPYFLSSGIWLLPDNLAWLLVYLTLVYALASASHRQFLFRAAIALFALVLVRQIHIWAAAPLVVAAYCPFYPVLDHSTGELLKEEHDLPLTNLSRRYPFALLAIVLTIPSFAAIAYFVHSWHGLTPPTFQGQYPIDTARPQLLRLFNAPAAPAFVLALFGVFGVFYAGFWLPTLLDSLKYLAGKLMLGAFVLFAFLAAAIPATTYSIAEGRWSGLWNFAQKFPTIGDHTSLLILPLSLLGAVVLWSCLASMFINHATICLAAIGTFAAAQAASFQLWQRYNEPFVLLMLILMLTTYFVRGRYIEAPTHRLALLLIRLRFFGPAILGVALAILSLTTFKNAKPSEFFDLIPGTDRTKAFLKGDPSIKPVPLPTQNP